jgi:hypothetical protein
MNHYAIFRGHICTANTDGSIPLNSKVACETYREDKLLLGQLIAQANLAASLADALYKLGLDNAPAIKDELVAYERSIDVQF